MDAWPVISPPPPAAAAAANPPVSFHHLRSHHYTLCTVYWTLTLSLAAVRVCGMPPAQLVGQVMAQRASHILMMIIPI